jgi:hypothetical protein
MTATCLEIKKVSVRSDGYMHDPTVKPGNESYAIVEFAPYQKIPTEKKKADNRNGTIEKGSLHSAV